MASQAFVYGYYETLEKLAAPNGKPPAGKTQYGAENMSIDPGQAPALGGRAPAVLPRRGGTMNFSDAPAASGQGGSMGVKRVGPPPKTGSLMKVNADMAPPPLSGRKPASIPMPLDTRMDSSQGAARANTTGRAFTPGAPPPAAPGKQGPTNPLLAQR